MTSPPRFARSRGGQPRPQPNTSRTSQLRRDFERLRAALAELMPPEAVAVWLDTPNPAFDEQAPARVIERGNADRVWEMINQIDANVAN